MSKAAEDLAVSRPVVSRAIADLERALAVPLFNRLHGTLTPTQYGNELLGRSFAVFDELRQSVQAIGQLKDSSHGELRFATGEPLAGGIAAAAIERLSRRIPVLSSNMEIIGPATVTPYLRDRRGEFAITRSGAEELDPDIAAKPLYNERLLVVAASDSPWRRRRRPAWPELLEAPWILSPAEVASDSPIVDALQAIGRALPARLIVSNSLNLRVGLLPSGRFLKPSCPSRSCDSDPCASLSRRFRLRCPNGVGRFRSSYSRAGHCRRLRLPFWRRCVCSAGKWQRWRHYDAPRWSGAKMRIATGRPPRKRDTVTTLLPLWRDGQGARLRAPPPPDTAAAAPASAPSTAGRRTCTARRIPPTRPARPARRTRRRSCGSRSPPVMRAAHSASR
jgi:DNA-binding transcriptional LysR family regulator